MNATNATTNQAAVSDKLKAVSQSPEVANAFADLDRARATLRDTEAAAKLHRNALRRWARARGLCLVSARAQQFALDRAAWAARVDADFFHARARREFQRLAMIAALTRVVDTDRRLNAAA